MKILQCGGGWPTNIGNAFIDYGMKYLLQQTFSRDEIFFTSNAIDWISQKYGGSKQSQHISLINYMKADYYVFGGSMLDLDWFDTHKSTYSNLVKNNSKIILIGVGGGDQYPDKEIEKIQEYLGKLNIFIFVSRDETAYNHYRDLAEHSYNGIDCAFFLSEAFNPIKMDIEKFSIFNFDKMKEPKIKVQEKIVRTHHEPWRVASCQSFSMWDMKMSVWNVLHHQINIIKKNDMVSDLPEDYLNLYANCQATYSDRIHACVATLSFGNSARLFTDSTRSLLFDRVGLSTIRSELTKLDKKYIQSEKSKEINFFKSCL